MSDYEVVKQGRQRIRIGPWRGDRSLGYIAPLSAPGSIDLHGLSKATCRLAERGFDTALTAALTEAEQSLFVDAGFELHERLHLLKHDLTVLPDSPSIKLRRGRRSDRASVVELDQRAFDEFWRLDMPALEEALDATPISRLRVALDGRAIRGYAVTGRSGRHAFLQRLAVDPEANGRGIGRALVADSLNWSTRRGAGTLAVNTQERNDRALNLYESLGFRRLPSGLAVLHLDGLRR